MLDKNVLSHIQNHMKGYVAHWVYTEHSRAVMVSARYDHNGIKTFRQFRCENGNWVEGVTQCCQNKTQQAGNQIGITKKDDGLKENMVSIPGLQTTVSSEEGYHESTRDLSKNQRFNP